jgi:hypothetical protein
MLRPPLINKTNTFSSANFKNVYTDKNISGNYSSWKINVDTVLTTNNSLYGLQSYIRGTRILAIGQTDGIYNGIYSVTDNVWKRANDMMSGISVAGVIVYDNIGEIYYFCSNISGEDIVGTDELVFIGIDFDTNKTTNYRENAVVIKKNNDFEGSYILVSGDNSLALNGEVIITANKNKTTIPVDINIYAYTYANTKGTFDTGTAPRGSNFVFNQEVELINGTPLTFTVNGSGGGGGQSIMFNDSNEQKQIIVKNGGFTFVNKYYSDIPVLTHDIGIYRTGNIVLGTNIVAASGTLTVVCNCDYAPITVYANVQDCAANQLINITTLTSGNQFSLVLRNVGNTSTDFQGVKVGFVCFDSPV